MRVSCRPTHLHRPCRWMGTQLQCRLHQSSHGQEIRAHISNEDEERRPKLDNFLSAQFGSLQSKQAGFEIELRYLREQLKKNDKDLKTLSKRVTQDRVDYFMSKAEKSDRVTNLWHRPLTAFITLSGLGLIGLVAVPIAQYWHQVAISKKLEDEAVQLAIGEEAVKDFQAAMSRLHDQ